MWFSDERHGIYWLTNSEARHEMVLPEMVPNVAPPRKVNDREGEEWIWDTFTGYRADGRAVRYNWICSDLWVEPVEGAVVKLDFPKVVTLQSLAEFHVKAGKKDTIRLDNHTTVVRNGTVYYLNCSGNRLISWGPNEAGARMWFHQQGTLNQHQVDALTKYLGSKWRLVGKDGLVGLQNEEGTWTMASQYAGYLLDGRVDARERYLESFQNPSLETHRKIVAAVRRYTQEITTEKVRKATAGMTNVSHSISTRCDGCQTLNAMHLTIHMARLDLDPFLIYAAYDAYGDEVNGGTIKQVWDLISEPTPLAVMKFKGVMENFLLDALRQQVQYACFLPAGRRAGANRWPLFGNHAPMMADGPRLIQGGRDDHSDGMSDGQYLALSRMQGEAPQPRPRLRRERVELVRAVRRLEMPEPRFEVDPFDVELDLNAEDL